MPEYTEKISMAYSKIEEIKKMGIPTKGLNAKLDKAKKARNIGNISTAEQILDGLLIDAQVLVEIYPKFSESVKGTEEAIALAKKEGADITEAQRLLEQARALLFEDLHEALACIHEAREASDNALKGLNKGVAIELEVLGAIPDKWTSGWITISNLGRGDVEELEVEFGGKCETDGLNVVGGIPALKSVKSPFKFMGRTPGNIPVKITVFYRNKFDGKRYSAHFLKWVLCGESSF